MIALICRRELRSLLSHPSSWLMLAALQFVLAWFFLANVESFLDKQAQLAQATNPPGVTMMVCAPTFQLLALLLMLIIPLFTMRAFAEEKRNQSMALLLAAPVSDLEILLGKFSGLYLFLLLQIAAIHLMTLTLTLGTTLDLGLLASNLFGLVLLSAALLSAGLYISILCSQPLIAALAALALSLALWLIDISASDEQAPWHLISPLHHFQSFNAGSISSESSVFFVLFSLFFLALGWRRLINNRRYGA